MIDEVEWIERIGSVPLVLFSFPPVTTSFSHGSHKKCNPEKFRGFSNFRMSSLDNSMELYDTSVLQAKN